MTQPQTTGTEFAEAARRYFHIGPRTRRYRKGRDLHADIAEATQHAATLPGYFTADTQAALRLAFPAVASYEKHILGYRVSPETVRAVNEMSAHRFVGLLAEMIDAGVSNTGEGERFFQTRFRTS